MTARRAARAMRHIDESGLLGLCGPVIVVVVRTAGPAAPLPQAVLAESLRDVTRGRSAGAVIGLANPDHGVLVAQDQGAAACRGLALHLGFKLARLIGLYPKQIPGTAAVL